MKPYRVDAFISGKHSKKYFRTEAQAIEYSERQSQRGEIVFLLKLITDKTYDVIKII